MEGSSWAFGSFLGEQEYFSSYLCSIFSVASCSFEDGAFTSTRNHTSPVTGQKPLLLWTIAFYFIFKKKNPLLVALVQCPLEIIDLHHPSRDVAVLDFSYKFDNNMVHIFKPVFYITNLKNDGILSLYQNRCQTQFLKFGKRVQFFTCNNYEPLGSTCDSILICALS